MIPGNLVQIQGEWVSGVEWSGVSVSVSQSVSEGGHQTYDHNLYIGIIILPPPLEVPSWNL